MHAEGNITCRSIVEKLHIWGSPAWIHSTYTNWKLSFWEISIELICRIIYQGHKNINQSLSILIGKTFLEVICNGEVQMEEDKQVFLNTLSNF